MAETTDPRPEYLRLTPELEDRLMALPQDLTGENFRSVLDETLSKLFDPDRSIHKMTSHFGDTPEVISAVQEGLVHSLEEVAVNGRTEDTPRHIIFPIPEYFKKPDALIISVMETRTDQLKSYFMLDELQAAIKGTGGGGRYIKSGFEITDHPEYTWVEVYADDHSVNGIRYRFYSKEPSHPGEISDVQYTVKLHYLDGNNSPTTEDYPYYVGMSVTCESKDIDLTTYQIPDEVNHLLGPIAKKLITEALIEQFNNRIETGEQIRGTMNALGRIITESVVDPVEARRMLEKLGIYDDPENFNP